MTVRTLEQALDRPDTKRRYVRRLFATIADRYDLITRVLSHGQDSRWKRRLIDLAEIRPGSRVLDLACGTGDLTFAAARHHATVVGLDITFRMIQIARAKQSGAPARPTWLVGDMTALPLASASFDLVTTGYGLRNVPDLSRALAEIHRVLQPGGRLCALDFNKPDSRPLRAVYLTYLTHVGAALGWMLHRDADTYRYIPASIRRYPGGAAVAELMRASGFAHAQHIPVFGGLMSIHVAVKGTEVFSTVPRHPVPEVAR